MPNYQDGKIYKITSGDLTYIGSTCEPTLARRLTKHKTDYKKWKEGKYGHTSSFTVIETGQYEITLIELFPCGSKDELNARERFHIETNVCVNKVIPCRTQEELIEYKKVWTEQNKDRLSKKWKLRYEEKKEDIREYKKNYQILNKDVISSKRKEYRLANRDEINARRREADQRRRDEKKNNISII
jgi:hypothetical protein